MTTAPRFCVIADDLTGALDTAAPFAAHGWRTCVLPWPDRDPAAAVAGAAARSDVVVVDTASRHLPAREAAGRVRAVVEAARGRRGAHFYKKIDSTLRGNVAAELSAFCAATGIVPLPLAPAFPAQGRTTRGGTVWVDGRPLLATSAARDPRKPVRSGNLAGLAPAGRLEVLDAETDRDLRRIAVRLARAGRLGAVAGSGGLAGALASALGRRQAAVRPAARGGVLLVSGSAHAAARMQVATLLAAGALGLIVPVGPRSAPGELDATVVLAADRLRAGQPVVLACPPLAPGARLRAGQAARAAARLADAARLMLATAPVDAVVTVGGDTTAAIVAALGWGPLEVAGSLEPGVAVVRLRGAGRPRWLITKSGAFGEPQTLRRLVRRLSTPRARSRDTR